MSSVESIDLHVRTYRSALKSTLEITINSLTNSHLKMESILHPLGSDPHRLDTAALIYCLLRLPEVIDKTDKVIIGQNPLVFAESGFDHVETWPKVSTPARRRTCRFHQAQATLAVFAASITDIDDLVNLLIGYQSEWNKLHLLLKNLYSTRAKFTHSLKTHQIITDLNLTEKDFADLQIALGPHSHLRFLRIYRHLQNLRLRQLAGSWVDFTKNTQKWWGNIRQNFHPESDITRHRFYFVSSNTHSLGNILSGFALKYEKNIFSLIKNSHPDLFQTLTQILNQESSLHQNDFLYYASKFLDSDPRYQAERQKLYRNLNFLTIPNNNFLDVTAQIFPVSSITKSKYLDSRLKISRSQILSRSDALIFNIDYPLGFAARNILNTIMENTDHLRGIYILGKSAVLNSEIGDIQIPRLVFDEHTQNTYMFRNCFNNFFPFPNNQGSILTNQKAVSVLGTFLENEALLEKYSQNNLTVIEMESGPYLSAITEATYNQQTPQDTIVDLNATPFDIGIINYTSDTPYSQAKNLGAGSLKLNGVEPVYLGSLAILQRIINLEESID